MSNAHHRQPIVHSNSETISESEAPPFLSFQMSKLIVLFRIAYTQARGYRDCFCRFHFYVLHL